MSLLRLARYLYVVGWWDGFLECADFGGAILYLETAILHVKGIFTILSRWGRTGFLDINLAVRLHFHFHKRYSINISRLNCCLGCQAKDNKTRFRGVAIASVLPTGFLLDTGLTIETL